MKKSTDTEKNSQTTRDFYGIKQAPEIIKTDETLISNRSSLMMMEGGSAQGSQASKMKQQVSSKQVKFYDADAKNTDQV